MPYDWDAEQAVEAEQQRVVEAATSALNRLVDSPEERAAVVMALVSRVHAPAAVEEPVVRDRVDAALAAVWSHTRDPLEVRLLTMRVCAKLFGGLASVTEGAWLRASFERREREDGASAAPGHS